MRPVPSRAGTASVVMIPVNGEGAGEATGYGKIKGRTSRLGRSVVLNGFFRLFRTSRATYAMCALSNYSVISTKAAHRGGKSHEL